MLEEAKGVHPSPIMAWAEKMENMRKARSAFVNILVEKGGQKF